MNKEKFNKLNGTKTPEQTTTVMQVLFDFYGTEEQRKQRVALIEQELTRLNATCAREHHF